jgi:hypothetical protein
MLDEQIPEWPEALIDLIDALRIFIRRDHEIARGLLNDGHITRAQYDEVMAATEPMIALLRKLEAWDFDPTLHGLIKMKFKL